MRRPMSSGLPAGETTTRWTVASHDSCCALVPLMSISPGPFGARTVADASRSVWLLKRALTSSGSAAALGF